MAKILVRGDSVYECDVCKRRIRVPSNRIGVDVMQRCVITHHCQGMLHRITLTKEINATPAFPPEVAGVQDWAQRRILYTHTQQVNAATWLIKHNLSNNPGVYVFINKNNELVQIEPVSIEPIDDSTIEITLSQAESGVAQCIASASQNTTNPTAIDINTNSTYVDLTHLGELTIATRTNSPNFVLALTYNSPTNPTPITMEYTGIGTASVLSPWSDANTVIVNGRRYYVRSVNLLTSPSSATYFEQGQIAYGSSITISTDVNANELLILLSNAPHQISDKISDRYLDAATLKTTPYLFYNNGIVSTDSTPIKNTYPPIIVD